MALPVTLTPRRDPGFRETALFRPESLVLLADPALDMSAVLAANIAEGGFKGPCYIIGMEAPGFTPLGDIDELPPGIDLAVLNLAPEALEPAMAALAARGCRSGIVPGSAPDLAGMIARTGLRVLGQGSFGLCVPSIGLNASLAHLPPRKGRLALVSQSAALARAVLDWAEAEAVGFSHIIGIGGNANLGFAPTLDWLARDAGTGAVLLDIRRIRNRRLFISAARATARTRPVVAIRPGGRIDDDGGSAEAVMIAALRRAGVLTVDGLEDLLAAAETLGRSRTVRRPTRPAGTEALRGDRVAIVANGTAPAQLAADALVKGGGRLATLSEPSRAALAVALPPEFPRTNPMILPPGSSTRLGEAAVALAALAEIDTVVALHAPIPRENGGLAAQTVIAAAKATRGAPVLVGWLGQATAGPQRRLLAEAGTAVFATPEAAIRGALHLAQDRRNRATAAELPSREVLALAPDRAAVTRIFAHVRAEGRLKLSEAEALAVFAAYGVPTIQGETARTPEEAATAADRLSYPVAVKLLSPDLPRKTEVGGVTLSLRSPAEVLEAAETMAARLGRERPEARLDGFLVQRMAGRGHELRLRLDDDPMFGPYIGFGRGGTFPGLNQDESIELPPLNRALATGIIRRSRLLRLLEGYRDWPAVDLLAIADTLVRLSQLAIDFPEIASSIVNPLLADARGVLALDAIMELRPAGERASLSIPPYPAELAQPWVAKNGARLLVRPIRPEDAEAQAAAFARLRPEDVRWRFFSQIRELSPEQIARLTQIDYEREMAFIAVESVPGEPDRTAGTARLVLEPGSAGGEFAVVVDPDWKGQGLGSHLMRRLIDWGRAQGLTHMAGQVLADNAPMLAFMRSLGFTIRRLPEDEELCEARLELQPG
ncbi:bifunctional acetate--CoA ligase family protein/GNAT family N-acetyltransferase [Acetobacteraceae bacterium H6797]|nr:bifunctional acetate--CoA ligase family protein/GNAT family N-acetyltransferase [Acetobacteraceae bacterium H6797]